MDSFHPIVQPLLAADMPTVQQLLWQYGEESKANRRKFVRQMRFIIFERAQGTPAFEAELAKCDAKNGEDLFQYGLLKCEKEALRLLEQFRRAGKLEQCRTEAVQTSPIDLKSNRWKPLVSKFGGVVELQDWLVDSLQAECDSAYRIDHELLQAWFMSDAYRSNANYSLRHPRVEEEGLRIGDKDFYLARHLLDNRMRRYDAQAALWTPQADFLSQSCMRFAQGFSMPAEDYFQAITRTICPGWEINVIEDLLAAPLHQVIDMVGIKRAAVIQDVRRYKETGLTHLVVSCDATTSGPGIIAARMCNVEVLYYANLLGGVRQDLYGRVTSKYRSRDQYLLANFEESSLRGLSKLIAKGGVFGAGAKTIAWHLLGLNPEDSKMLDESWGEAYGSLTFEERLDVPDAFKEHPMFENLWHLDRDGNLTLNLGVDAENVLGSSHRWATTYGYKALHQAMPMLNGYIGFFRKLNEKSVNSGRGMLGFKFNEQEVRNIPYTEAKEGHHMVRTKVDGVEYSCQQLDAGYNDLREVAVNETHSIDALALALTILRLKSKDIPVHGNHDAVKVPLPFVETACKDYTDCLIEALRMAGPLQSYGDDLGIDVPRGDMPYEDLLVKIADSGARNMFPDAL